MRKLMVVITILLLAMAQTADAQNKKARAAKYFDKAVEAYDSHDYKTALDAFKTAYELVPHWRVLAHVGTCYAKLNKPVKAIEALEQYLEEGGSQISPDERRVALEMLEEQGAKVGTLYLHVAPRGTEVTIDGESVGRAPFQKILLLSGPHHIIIIDGDKAVEKDIRIEPQKEIVVRYPERSDGDSPVGPTTPGPEVPPRDEVVPPAAGPVEAGGQLDFNLEADVDIGEELEKSSGPKATVPVFIALGVAGVGAIVGAVGWGLYIDNMASVKNYDNELKKDIYSDGAGEHFDYADDCKMVKKDGDTVYSIPDSPWAEKQGLYCMSEFERREYQDNARAAFIPAVVGTSLAVVGGVLGLVFAFNPEWFESEGESDAEMTLSPVTAPGYAGMSFSRRF